MSQEQGLRSRRGPQPPRYTKVHARQENSHAHNQRPLANNLGRRQAPRTDHYPSRSSKLVLRHPELRPNKATLPSPRRVYKRAKREENPRIPLLSPRPRRLLRPTHKFLRLPHPTPNRLLKLSTTPRPPPLRPQHPHAPLLLPLARSSDLLPIQRHRMPTPNRSRRHSR